MACVVRIRIKPSRDEDKDAFSEVHGFVGLESNRKKPKNENEQAISSGVDYRSIEGPKTTHELSSDEEESDQEEGETFDEYIRRRTIEQNRHLDEVKRKRICVTYPIVVLTIGV